MHASRTTPAVAAPACRMSVTGTSSRTCVAGAVMDATSSGPWYSRPMRDYEGGCAEKVATIGAGSPASRAERRVSRAESTGSSFCAFVVTRAKRRRLKWHACAVGRRIHGDAETHWQAHQAPVPTSSTGGGGQVSAPPSARRRPKRWGSPAVKHRLWRRQAALLVALRALGSRWPRSSVGSGRGAGDRSLRVWAGS